MNPEIDELRPKLKEILYDCAVEIRCTKAAVYLFDGGAKFELVTEYGFRSGGIPLMVDENDPILKRCGHSPFFVNGLTTEPRFAERLYAAATDRLLAAPIHLRGRIVGFIDSRDKAGKEPFVQSDAPKIQKIADRMAALFVNKNVFGQHFIMLSDTEEVPAISTPVVMAKPRAADSAQRPQQQVQRREELSPVATLIIEARGAAARSAIAPVAAESISEVELAAAREVLRKMLAINGAVVVSFTAFGHMGGVQEIASKGALTGETLNYLQSELSGWLAKRGEPAGSLRTSEQTPLGILMPPIVPRHILNVFTAPVVAGALRGLYLTVGFAEAPERAANEMLAMLLDELQLVIDASMTRTALQTLRLRVAEKLLEPEFTKYPEIRNYAERVFVRTGQFLKVLSLSPAEAETVRLAAIVHDAGIRLLDYGLYRKRALSSEDFGILREHVFVGAVMVEPLLGHDVALAVLNHHERIDGRGYPNGLKGDEIPMAARVLQICDAYESMIDAQTSQPVESPESALEAIARGAGTQFDKDLARKFIEMMRAAAPAGASD